MNDDTQLLVYLVIHVQKIFLGGFCNMFLMQCNKDKHHNEIKLTFITVYKKLYNEHKYMYIDFPKVCIDFDQTNNFQIKAILMVT